MQTQADVSNFELALSQTLERQLAGLDGHTPTILRESIQYSLLAPGKRIRPRLLLTCGQMLGLSSAQTLPAAMALEMIHCFTLIHDDLPCMDDDDWRRGLPSNHKKFGEDIALLAGDSLIALAAEVFLETPVEPKRLIPGLKRLIWASGPRGVTGGQAAENELTPHSPLEQLYQMHRQKTGALFLAALLIPSDLAGIETESREGQSILSFARELGLAFQIADDLEDLTANLAPRAAFVPDPTHILFYLSPHVARQQTLERLRGASQQLHAVWGSRSDALCQLADEVLLKIESTAHAT